ncbi:MAG: hypothetical protein IJ094_12975 [Bacilli bacterium]|nr:hypothetical protein [Bacilli bacterium]
MDNFIKSLGLVGLGAVLGYNGKNTIKKYITKVTPSNIKKPKVIKKPSTSSKKGKK